jgi:hypothetical protein
MWTGKGGGQSVDRGCAGGVQGVCRGCAGGVQVPSAEGLLHEHRVSDELHPAYHNLSHRQRTAVNYTQT